MTLLIQFFKLLCEILDFCRENLYMLTLQKYTHIYNFSVIDIPLQAKRRNSSHRCTRFSALPETCGLFGLVFNASNFWFQLLLKSGVWILTNRVKYISSSGKLFDYWLAVGSVWEMRLQPFTSWSYLEHIALADLLLKYWIPTSPLFECLN